MNDRAHNDFHLLPYRFKKFAYGIFFLGVLLGILLVFNLLPIDKETGKEVLKSVFLFSMLLLSLCKEKVENKQTFRMRAKLLSASLIYGTVLVIATPTIHLIFEGNFAMNISPQELMIQIFIFYFIMKYIIK